MKKVQTYYQRLILEDIYRPRYQRLTKFFPWFMVMFILLQIYYYFHYFYGTVIASYQAIISYHQQFPLNVAARRVMFSYDHFIGFLLYLFLIFVFLILAFIAFDSSQRSHIIRRLSENEIKEHERDTQ